jgi:hypothetical protein
MRVTVTYNAAIIDAWPLKTEDQYGSIFLACDGRVERTIVTGTVVVESCGSEISGSSLKEIRSELERHIGLVPHVDSF